MHIDRQFWFVCIIVGHAEGLEVSAGIQNGYAPEKNFKHDSTFSNSGETWIEVCIRSTRNASEKSS